MYISFKKIAILFSIFLIIFCCIGLGYQYKSAEAASKSDAADGGSKKDFITLPIVMYHSTSNKHPNKYNIPPSQFENDLKFIKEKGYTAINVADLLRYMQGEKLPEKIIMITFDDGYMNNYVNIFPILKKYNMKCVMSVIGYHTDSNYCTDGTISLKHSHMCYEHIKEMHSSGLVEIQNHTYYLHVTKTRDGRNGMKMKKGESYDEYEKMLSADLMKLHNKIKERTGITCTAVAYPYGLYSNPETFKVLEKIGYKAGFTCCEGINYINRQSSLYGLKRYNRPSGISSENFFKKMNVI